MTNTQYELYIPNKASILRTNATKRKLSGVSNKRYNKKRGLSAPAFRQRPYDFGAINLNYGQKNHPTPPPILRSGIVQNQIANLSNELTEAKVDIDNLKTQLNICQNNLTEQASELAKKCRDDMNNLAIKMGEKTAKMMIKSIRTRKDRPNALGGRKRTYMR